MKQVFVIKSMQQIPFDNAYIAYVMEGGKLTFDIFEAKRYNGYGEAEGEISNRLGNPYTGNQFAYQIEKIFI